jgi:chromosome segregation ATPase
MVLCTLAVCVSVLASTLAISNTVRAEAKKNRSAIAKVFTDPLEPSAGGESIVQRLSAIDGQLAALNKRVALLERTTPAAARPAAEASSQDDVGRNLHALEQSVSGLGTQLARMNGVPAHLAELTTYLDRSFEHVEKTVAASAAPSQDVQTALDEIGQRLDSLDDAFTPLYLFLGLPLQKADQDLLISYPSVDERMNDLSGQLEAVRKDVSAIKSQFRFRNNE